MRLQSRKYPLFFTVPFSLLFSFVLVLGNHIQYSGDIWGNFTENTFISFTLADILWFAILAMLCFFALQGFLILADKISPLLISSKKSLPYIKKLWLGSFFLLILCWTPYILTYMPGGIFSDAFLSIGQALGNSPLNNHHPILYTLLIKVILQSALALGGNVYAGVCIYTILQSLAMAGILSYFLVWLYKKRISWAFIILSGLFFALFPLFPFYALAMWKDTLFSLFLFLYILFYTDILLSKGMILKQAKGQITYAILAILVSFFRNNGIYVVTVSLFLLLFLYRKQLVKQLKYFFISSCTMTVIIFTIQGPVYAHYGLNTEFEENLGIPLQQLGRVIYTDGNISSDQSAYLFNLCSKEDWKNYYVPCITDSLKWYAPSFDDAYLEQTKTEFLKTWLAILPSNIKEYGKAYLLQTCGFWAPQVYGWTGYTQEEVWFSGEYGLVETDWWEALTGYSLKPILSTKHYYSAAVFIWLMIGSSVLTLQRRRDSLGFAFIPGILLWGTIMIATPIALSLRYVYIVVLLVPLALLLPCLPMEHPHK